MTSEQTQHTLKLYIQRSTKHVRSGNTYIVLHGQKQTATSRSCASVTLRIGPNNCSLDTADVIALARDGDSLSLTYSIAEWEGEKHAWYSRAVLTCSAVPHNFMVVATNDEANHAVPAD